MPAFTVDTPYRSIVDKDGTLLAQIPDIPPRSLPVTVILDRDGRVAVQIVGPIVLGTLRGHHRQRHRIRSLIRPSRQVVDIACGSHWGFVPLVTVRRVHSVDLDRVDTIVESMLAAEVHGIVACGTTGEGYASHSTSAAR